MICTYQNGKEGENLSYIFTDYNQMVGKRPRQVYWQELQDAIVDLENKVASSVINIVDYKSATATIHDYPVGITSFQVTEDVDTGYPSLDGIVETIHISEFRNIQHFFEFTADNAAGAVYHRQWKPGRYEWTPWVRLLTTEDAKDHFENQEIHLAPVDRQRLQGYAHYQPAVSTTWEITHNLNKYPSVTITDSAGNMVIGDVKYLTPDKLQVTFTVAFSGTAYLN